MEKNYEKHGVPKFISTQMHQDEVPDYVSGYYCINHARTDIDTPEFESPKGFPTTSFQKERGLLSVDLSLWLSASKWTTLEAAMLFSGVNPNDDELYAAVKHYYNVNDENTFLANSEEVDADYVTWKYEYEFEFAADLMFLFERSDLAPLAKPYDWFHYLINNHVGLKKQGFFYILPPIADVLYDFANHFEISIGENNTMVSGKPLVPKERDTLLKIIGGLAIDGYKMDIHAKRLSGVSELLDNLALVGVTIDQDTLSKHLKAASQLIPKPKSV